MIVSRGLAWLLFLAWVTWGFALQGWLGGGSRWMPDLGLVLALSLLARLDARGAPLLALCVALARASLSSEPAVALLAGASGVVLLALAARSVVELTGPLWRAAVAGALVFVFDAWLMAVHHVRARDLAGGLPFDPIAILPAALTSALLALVLGPALVHLPGLSPLRSRRW